MCTPSALVWPKTPRIVPSLPRGVGALQDDQQLEAAVGVEHVLQRVELGGQRGDGGLVGGLVAAREGLGGGIEAAQVEAPARACADGRARRCAGELEVGERARSFFFWPSMSPSLRARFRDGGGAIDVYVNFECSAGPRRRRRARPRRRPGRLYSRRDSPSGSCHDPRPPRSRRPAVRCDAGRVRCRHRPGPSRSRRPTPGRCGRWSRPSSRPSPRTTASARSRTPRRRSAQMFGTPGALHGDGARQLPGRLPAERGRLPPSGAGCEGQLVQGVHLTDAGGALWLAVYRLERQPDRSWRISGCNVQPSDRQADLSARDAVSRHRRRQHPPQVGAVRRARAGRRPDRRTARSSSRRSTTSPRPRGTKLPAPVEHARQHRRRRGHPPPRRGAARDLGRGAALGGELGARPAA